jgi:hypothetical protein
MNEVTSLSAAAAVIIAAAVSLPLTSAAQAQQGSHAATAAHRIHNRVQFVDRKPDYFARAPFIKAAL